MTLNTTKNTEILTIRHAIEALNEQELSQQINEQYQNAAIERYHSQKICQCRYCSNSSNEGNGVWLTPTKWICLPCAYIIITKLKQPEALNGQH